MKKVKKLIATVVVSFAYKVEVPATGDDGEYLSAILADVDRQHGSVLPRSFRSPGAFVEIRNSSNPRCTHAYTHGR